jgi:hypothetical protein
MKESERREEEGESVQDIEGERRENEREGGRMRECKRD